MPWIYFGFINCNKNDVEYNERQIGYLLRFIEEQLKHRIKIELYINILKIFIMNSMENIMNITFHYYIKFNMVWINTV